MPKQLTHSSGAVAVAGGLQAHLKHYHGGESNHRAVESSHARGIGEGRGRGRAVNHHRRHQGKGHEEGPADPDAVLENLQEGVARVNPSFSA